MMPKAANKRKTRGDDSLDASSELLVQDGVTRPTKRSRGKSLSRLDETDDDASRGGSRDFHGWAKWLEETSHGEALKSKGILKAFEQKASNQGKQLRGLLEKHESTLQTQDIKLMSVLKKVYSAIQPSSTQAITGKRTAELADEEPNLLHEAHALISDSRSVIESYLGMNESLKRHKLELPAGTLKKDKQDIKEVLECGRQHGEDIAEDYLLPNTYTSAEAGRTKINGHQQTAAEMFQDSRKTVQDGAGAVIAQQMLGFRQLVDAIPRDRNRS